MVYKANPQWFQAHQQYKLADCEADFSKYTDPRWKKAYQDYTYYKNFGLDQPWNNQWIQIKLAYDKIDKEVELAKEQTQPCATYKA